jgi:hypothetical protein
MKLYLDCEFTNFQGHLISMALVDENGHEFYEVVNYSIVDCHPWVVQNVLPILHKDPIPYEDFQRKLSAYLRKYNELEIIADWPEDFWHLNMALLTGPGQMMTIPNLTMKLVRRLNYISAIPHNALEDAKAIRIACMKKDTP